VTHQIIIDGLLAGLAVALLQLGLLERVGDVKGARVEPAVLIAAVPGIIVIVRRGCTAGAGAVDAVALGRRVRRRRRAVPVQVPGIIRRVYIIVTATEACTRVFRGLRGGFSRAPSLPGIERERERKRETEEAHQPFIPGRPTRKVCPGISRVCPLISDK